MQNLRHRAAYEVEQELYENTEKDGQIDTLKMDFINFNVKSLGTIAKYKMGIYISYKIDTGSDCNILPFHINKNLFPR